MDRPKQKRQKQSRVALALVVRWVYLSDVRYGSVSVTADFRNASVEFWQDWCDKRRKDVGFNSRI